MSMPDVGESVQTDIESMIAAEETPAVDVSVPESLRGRSLSDVYAEVERMQNTNKINEEMIRRLASQGERPVNVTVAAPTQSAPAQQEMSDEELETFGQTHGQIALFRVLTERNNRMLASAMNDRLAPLAHGMVSSAEADARRKYALDFELFGPEIEAQRKTVDPSVFSRPESWSQMISMIRGSDGNVEKYVRAQQVKSGVQPLETMQQDERFSAGFVPTARANDRQPINSSALSDLQKKIASDFGMTEAEYRKIDKMSDQL